MEIQLHPVGCIYIRNDAFVIEVSKEYRPALSELEGFSHLQVIFWAHLFDGTTFQKSPVIDKPYKRGPDKVGLFATRSPHRPNPVLLSIIVVQQIDHKNGLIITPFIDAEDGSPLLDIKPYHMSERVRDCRVPEWCNNWPQWYEDSASFDWKNEFTF